MTALPELLTVTDLTAVSELVRLLPKRNRIARHVFAELAQPNFKLPGHRNEATRPNASGFHQSGNARP